MATSNKYLLKIACAFGPIGNDPLLTAYSVFLCFGGVNSTPAAAVDMYCGQLDQLTGSHRGE